MGQGGVLTTRGSYAFTIHGEGEGVHAPIVSIIDFDQSRELPCDVDAILADLTVQGINVSIHRFLYRDRGGWYELKIDADETCIGFKMLHTESEPEARAKLLNRVPARKHAIADSTKPHEAVEEYAVLGLTKLGA